MIETPQYPVDVPEVRRHYDRLSPLYRMLWGEHIHHGYWTGPLASGRSETPAKAQIQLMEQLARRAAIPRGASVLDIGCGIGGSAIWLAKNLDCRVTGVTISPVQARMASKAARKRGLGAQVKFVVGDANEWKPEPHNTDAIWIMESSEHFPAKANFFRRCAEALRPGGKLAVCAWLRREGAVRPEEQQLVGAVAEAMMSASLDSLSSYAGWMTDAGLTVTVAEDITSHVAPTWDHCARMVQNPFIRFFVRFMDRPTQRFVKSFPLMQEAYETGAMAFGLLVAQKSGEENGSTR